MNAQLKWSIQDTIIKNFSEMIKKGFNRDKLIITIIPTGIIPEAEAAIKFLLNCEYIEKLNETQYIVTQGYYDWIKSQLEKETNTEESLNFNISTKLKQRFCKDMNIPIKIFHEPYFESRIRLYDSQYDSIKKYKDFLELINNFKSEEAYFEYYNNLRDDMINYLGSREGMKRFKEENMNKFRAKHENLPSKDIYKENNDGRLFISLDMKKANFTALRHYDSSIVGNKNTYEEFVGMFTEYEFFKKSKYIRQVVFGNQNPKRQVTYEKYLMDLTLDLILHHITSEKIAFFSNDEIVIDITDMDERYRNELIESIIPNIVEEQARAGIDLKQENFLLRKIPGTKGYIKKFLGSEKYEFKCLDSLIKPFVLRAYLGEKIREEDKVFFYEGRLAKLIEIPEIKVV